MFNKKFLDEVIGSIKRLNNKDIELMVDTLHSVRTAGGRLFIIGSGGGAGHASHAVCDFRKLCNIEAYAPYDNVSELTARTNDEGYNTTIMNWLEVSNLCSKDCIFVFSVGGGKDGVSENITNALSYAHSTGASIMGVVGRDGGKTKELSDACVVIGAEKHTTPIVEGLQSVIWHLIVSHPKLQINETKW